MCCTTYSQPWHLTSSAEVRRCRSRNPSVREDSRSELRVAGGSYMPHTRGKPGKRCVMRVGESWHVYTPIRIRIAQHNSTNRARTQMCTREHDIYWRRVDYRHYTLLETKSPSPQSKVRFYPVGWPDDVSLQRDSFIFAKLLLFVKKVALLQEGGVESFLASCNEGRNLSSI